MGQKVVIRPTATKGVVFLVTGDRGQVPTVTLPDGRVIQGKYKNSEGNQHQYTFGLGAGDAQGARFTYGDTTTEPLDFAGGRAEYRTENGGLAGIDQAPNKALRGMQGGGMGFQPGSTFGGGFGGGQAAPMFTDASSLFFNPVSVAPIPTPNYQPIDPQVYVQGVAAQNRQGYLDNLKLSQNAALGFAKTEQQVNNNFAPAQSRLQQQLSSSENAFNRGEIATSNQFNPGQVDAGNRFNKGQLDLAIAESGLPIRDVVNEGLARARQLAKGFLPTTLEDKAFEAAARARAGDDAVARGLGTSAFTQNAIDKYTIGERLNLAQYGSSETEKYLGMGAKLLLDAPIKYNPLLSSPLSAKVSQDVRGSTSFSAGGAQQAEQGNLNQLTSFTPAASLGLFDQQRQYRAGLEDSVNKFNNQMSFNQQTFNSTGNFNQQLTQLSNDQNNASKAFNFAQNVANSVNAQYQQNLAQYANQIGYGQATAPMAPLGATQNPGVSPVYQQPLR